MAAQLNQKLPEAVVNLVPGGRGDFTVTVDGQVVWDKHAEGGFPDEGALVSQIAG